MTRPIDERLDLSALSQDQAAFLETAMTHAINAFASEVDNAQLRLKQSRADSLYQRQSEGELAYFQRCERYARLFHAKAHKRALQAERRAAA